MSENVASVPKSYGKVLVDAAGNKLRFIAHVRKDGSVNTAVNHQVVGKDGKVTRSSRGATANYTSMDEAKAALDQAARIAQKQGWVERKGGGGFRPRPDAFSLKNIPAPATK